MSFYIKRTYVDTQPGIELVNIHYTWTPVGQKPTWDAPRETRAMPRGGTLIRGMGGTTVAESGVPGFEFTLWFGVWGPAGMPADVIDKISKDVNRALADAGVRERLAKLGNDTMSMTPAEFSQFVRREIDDYARVTKAAGIKPQ